MATPIAITEDRKSTRLNSSHSQISYAVFCLKKKKKLTNNGMDESLQKYYLIDNKVTIHSHILVKPIITQYSAALLICYHISRISRIESCCKNIRIRSIVKIT